MSRKRFRYENAFALGGVTYTKTLSVNENAFAPDPPYLRATAKLRSNFAYFINSFEYNFIG